MIEQMYKLVFNSSDDTYQLWIESGYDSGFLILLFSTLVICLLYYLFLGYISAKYATIAKWFISMLISGIIVLTLSVTLIGFSVFGAPSLFDISWEVWRFSLFNMLYSFFLYFIPLSIVLKYVSRHNRYVPF